MLLETVSHNLSSQFLRRIDVNSLSQVHRIQQISKILG